MMTGVLPPVVAHLLGDIKHFEAQMGKAKAIMVDTTSSGAAKWRSFGLKAAASGAIIAGAALAVGMHMVDNANQFDAIMMRSHTQGSMTIAQVEAMKPKVLELSNATGVGAEAIAQGMYHVSSAGYTGKAALNALTEAAHLSMLSGASMDETTYGLISTMKTFGATQGEASKYAALFNATVSAGDMQMDAFNRAVGTGFYATAKTFGISAQSASAALAFMTDRGAHADEAATRLRMTIALMAAPSAKATKILQGLGLTATDVAVSHEKVNGVLKRSRITYSQLADDLRKPDGFYVALTHLKKALMDSGMSAQAADAQLSHAFGGGKSDAALLSMLNELNGPNGLKNSYDRVGAGIAKYGEHVRTAQQTAAVSTARAKEALHNLGIEIGEQLSPYVAKFMDWIRQAADWLTKHTAAAKILAGVLVGAFAIGLLVATAGLISFAAGMIAATWEIILIIAAIAAVVAAVIYLWRNWHTIWGWIVDHVKMAVGWIKQHWLILAGAVFPLIAAIHLVWTHWSQITQWIRTAVGNLVTWVSSHWDMVKAKTAQVWDGIINWFKGLPGQMWNIGVDLLKGLVGGIASFASQAIQDAINVGANIVNGIKSFFGINSPSTLMRDEVGKMLPAGISVGIEANAQMATGSAARLAAQVAAAHRAALSPLRHTLSTRSFATASFATSSANTLVVHLSVEGKVDGKRLLTIQQTHALQYQKVHSQTAFAQ